MINEFHYPKPKRLPIGPRIKGKEYMSPKDVDWLFKSRLLIEEKMDGKQVFFEAGNYILWCEDLLRKHSIKYRVPGRYALFDVYDRNKKQFLDWAHKIEVWEDIRRGKILIKDRSMQNSSLLIFPVPKVAVVRGKTPLEIANLITFSVYAKDGKLNPAMMEGVVIKQDRIQFYIEFITGKLVREEFEKGITTNYLNLPKENNIIDPSIPVVLEYNHI
ncbi:MAG: RNA ligase family protein [Candidatus Micrarchaeia archaeon]